MIGQNLPAYFLQFADNGKRFSYSPSLTGTQKFSEEQHSRIQKYIREMDIISCRDCGMKFNGLMALCTLMTLFNNVRSDAVSGRLLVLLQGLDMSSNSCPAPLS